MGDHSGGPEAEAVAIDCPPWEQKPDEPGRWYQQFERYRLLGPDRSLLAAFNQWRIEKGRKVSTRAPKTWRDAAARCSWQSRAEAWDKYCSDLVAAEAEARRLEILRSGYAQRHERVKALNDLADLLLAELQETDKRWLPDVKSVGQGQYAERVDIVRFNEAIIKEFRAALADIAAEQGDRKQQQEHSGSVSLVFGGNVNPEDL
jgi:hypothetical protein